MTGWRQTGGSFWRTRWTSENPTSQFSSADHAVLLSLRPPSERREPGPTARCDSNGFLTHIVITLIITALIMIIILTGAIIIIIA